ncbi:glycogen/starch synthase [uncultured Alistipes sp.]|uniref:glycogen/starch synthase n=1 Tax=uncultured Alistipes sp. TaxID=538949 RepID=UPI0026114410|nr:glycogen/starch synthase [uncultured Alistipes sp.]
MSHCKILYVCQEITPYLPETDMSVLCRTLSQGMQEKGNEIRTFMPRYGSINERRNQLHEVIRLSGMNLIIDNNDHQLIIKVASIPSARVQIYFIDNEDYFHRKATVRDAEGRLFADNDERIIFFARGVLETVKKLRWSPDLVHCVGWFSAIVPVYLRNAFADDPVFKNVKIVLSVYDDGFEGELDRHFKTKMQGEGVGKKYLSMLDEPTYENLMKFVIHYADGVIFETPTPPEGLRAYLEEIGKPSLEYQDKSSPAYQESYQAFYNKILANE